MHPFPVLAQVLLFSSHDRSPLAPPRLKPPPTPVRVSFVAGGMTNRHEFVRGEKVSVAVAVDAALKADEVRMELRSRPRESAGSSGQPLLTEVRRLSPWATFMLDTGPYGYGEYALTVTALAGSKVVATTGEVVGIRYIPPEQFNWEIWHSAGKNRFRAEAEFADIRAAGMELYLTSTDPLSVDLAIRNGLGFSLRAYPEFLPAGKEVTFDKNPEYFRHNNKGQPIATAYSGGRPSLGISHPEIRANAVQSMRAAVATVAEIPAFRPYVLCNDDFSIYYGWDYAPHVLAAFQKDTGLQPPREMVKPQQFGPVPDNDPWVTWFAWTLLNVNGAFNQAETQGALQARADVRVGPIPGGMQIPLVQLWEPSQYPPYNFGKNGFNLICSYYYNTYWQPVMTATFWMEIGRMGNRDLPQWNMPDAFSTAGYTRNNLFHYLAGGVRGLAYFTYASRNENSWPEFQRLGKVIRRIGPVQARLVPAQREIGLLNSFTSHCFDPSFTLVQVYACHNLMQGHFDVELVSEDEIAAGRASQYKAILLYNVPYLRQSVYDALAQHAAHGGLVILDRTIPFDLPGAKRLPVDIGMGTERTQPFPAAGAHVSTPGIRDYGHTDRVAVIKHALSVYVKPQFDSDDIKLVATRFEAEGAPYTWFVNVHDAKEHLFCRERMGAGHAGAGTPDKVREVREWEAAETAKGPYTSTIALDSLPGIPYDLITGRRLTVRKTPDGRHQLRLSMDRFGGALVAWLPAPIPSWRMAAPPRAEPLQTVLVVATAMAGRQPVAGPVPIEFTLRDPQGNVSVLSGVRATRKGEAVLEWLPAVNDPRGNWCVQAIEHASGRTVTRRIHLDK